MAVLTQQQRSILESAVKLARRTSELGAVNALRSMAVDHPEPFTHMDADQRRLRNNLRSKARLLGDKLEANGRQQIQKLAYELAYEYWHKMLFAKFLEANNLLIHPDGVAVGFEDVEEYAKEEGFADKWDAAASYASRMLPAIFRPEDPLMQVPYAPNDRIKLEEILEGLESSIFIADDALGWVYQFWQSEAKATINASGDKIDGEKLPAVTQLFTEPYMVHFLIDNTLGAWWVNRNQGITPPIKFEYLRLLDDGTPAAGKYEGWPDKTAEITSLDPCMGSAHFIVSLFSVFVVLRMFEEKLSKEEATDRVISENLHGLELDPRCTQLAAFNLALTAWKFCGHYKELPEMNLACSGIAPKGKLEDWVKLVGKVERTDDRARMENGMKMLYEHFQLAPELGSLLDPSIIKADAFSVSYEQLQPVLKKILEDDAENEQLVRGVLAAGIAKVGDLLTKKFTLIITNVPYLGRGKHSHVLMNFCFENYPDSKSDLATVFIEKMLKLTITGGTTCCVSPQNWLFLSSYEKLRKKLFLEKKWNLVARIGEGGFNSSAAAGAFTSFIIISLNSPHSNVISTIDASIEKSPSNKSAVLIKGPITSVNQASLLKNPGSRFTLVELSNTFDLLEKTCYSYQGLVTGDLPRFVRKFWELSLNKNDLEQWVILRGSIDADSTFGGNEDILFWQNGCGELHEYANFTRDQLHDMHESGNLAWGKKGIAINRMRNLRTSLYLGEHFHNNLAVIIPKKEEYLLPLYAYSQSPEFQKEIRKIDQKISLTNKTILQIPFQLEYWEKVVKEIYINGLPKPISDDPTQWLFHGHPLKTDNPLQVAVARLLGYQWLAESDAEMELADEARSLINDVKEFDHMSDEDGIFCIPSVNAEAAGADRLRDYIQTVFANEWTSQTINQLLVKEGAKSPNLEEWLRDEFFTQHCKVFQNRPFIWHIWDGRKDGFSALVNYHKLDKDNLSKLIYTYLGDWIRMCEAKKKANESGAEGLLSAAQRLKEKLEAILIGESPFDIFIRWKPLDQQPIGWEPELNDGVRLNIRPFMEADVLRKRPNIKWGIDRGKNPPGSPWGEVRDNDKHLSLEEKRAARTI